MSVKFRKFGVTLGYRAESSAQDNVTHHQLDDNSINVINSRSCYERINLAPVCTCIVLLIEIRLLLLLLSEFLLLLLERELLLHVLVI